jgi:hypothetical protein
MQQKFVCSSHRPQLHILLSEINQKIIATGYHTVAVPKGTAQNGID